MKHPKAILDRQLCIIYKLFLLTTKNGGEKDEPKARVLVFLTISEVFTKFFDLFHYFIKAIYNGQINLKITLISSEIKKYQTYKKMLISSVK